MRIAATRRLSDEAVLTQIAKRDPEWRVREAATRGITDAVVLTEIACEDKSGDVSLLAAALPDSAPDWVRSGGCTPGSHRRDERLRPGRGGSWGYSRDPARHPGRDCLHCSRWRPRQRRRHRTEDRRRADRAGRGGITPAVPVPDFPRKLFDSEKIVILAVGKASEMEPRDADHPGALKDLTPLPTIRLPLRDPSTLAPLP